jgi:2-methylisocitrate lyase-like PEP mutase family enzyme
MTDKPSKNDQFRQLHERQQIFVIPNPWDIGSARLLESLGFEALTTTSAGFAWSLGRNDMNVRRDELVWHVAAIAASIDIPLNVDAERCFAETTDGVQGTVRLLAEAGASGFSIEDWNPATGRVDAVGLAAERVAAAVEAAHHGPHPLLVTARAENHIHGITDFDDTLARLVAFREAGADAVFAPGLSDIAQIKAVVETVGLPVNVIAMPTTPTVAELGAVGVRRVSTGGSLAKAAYGGLMRAARELLEHGTSTYTVTNVSNADLQSAFRTR